MREPLVILLMTLLVGCSSPGDGIEGKMETLYRSESAPSVSILRRTTVHKRVLPLSPEGTQFVNASFDFHYFLRDEGQILTDLNFLDSLENPPTGAGLISKIFHIS